MVRAVALVAQDRLTRPLSTFPRSSPEKAAARRRGAAATVMVITELDVGDPEATPTRRSFDSA